MTEGRVGMGSALQPRVAIVNLPLHQQVAGHLRELIISGQLAPGAELIEREMTEMLGVSRTPLREALKILARENLVQLLPRRGAWVSKPKVETITHGCDLIGVLQGHAAAMLCQRITDEQIAELRRLNDAIRDYYGHEQPTDPLKYIEANQAFHLRMAEMCDDLILLDLHTTVFAHVQRSMMRVAHALQPGALQERFCEEHEDIVDLLKRGDPQEAERAMRAHWHEMGREFDVLAGVEPSDIAAAAADKTLPLSPPLRSADATTRRQK